MVTDNLTVCCVRGTVANTAGVPSFIRHGFPVK